MEYTIDCSDLSFESKDELANIKSARHPSVRVIGDSPLLIGILGAISANPCFKRLELVHSRFMSLECTEVVARIEMQITDFSVHGGAFGTKRGSILADAIRRSSTLRTLTLSSLALYGSLDVPLDALLLADGMAESKTCRSLVLNTMFFSDHITERFASTFSRLESLDICHVNWNAQLALGIASAAELKSLTLRFGKFSEADTRVVCRALRHLTHLNLDGFELSAKAFCTALSQPDTALKSLFIGERAFHYNLGIVDAMTCIGGVEVLGIYVPFLGSGTSLARAISHSTALRTLRIDGWSEGGAAGAALVHAVGENGGIRELEISGDFVRHSALCALASAVLKSRDLEILTVKANIVFAPAPLDELAKAVAASSRIVHAHVTDAFHQGISDAVKQSVANGALLAFRERTT
jgi:hypothetical protein